MNKIFIWWYCEKDNPDEMLKYASFNLINAECKDEAIRVIDKHIKENEHDSYACSYRKGKISIGMMETNYIQTTVLGWDKPVAEDD